MATATARAFFGLGHDLTDEELVILTASDNRPALKAFLAERAKLMWYQISYDQVDLVALIERAVGKANVGNINRDIDQTRFPLRGIGVRLIKCRVEPYLNGETREQGAKRLKDAGHTLGNTGDLAGFLHDHPNEVEKWGWVDAISEDSRWTRPGGHVLVPCACVRGARRRFYLRGFRNQPYSGDGVLVVS